MSAWFLQVGIEGLIQGAGNLLRTGIAEMVNFVIRSGFHDMMEISVHRWPWHYYATIFLVGVVFLAIGLAVAYWAAQRGIRKDRQEKALA
jgi:predicted Na+-dependent transporter